MQTLSATVAHTTYSHEEYPVILPATDTLPAVVAIPDKYPHEPDYCGGNLDNGTPLGDFLLGWDRNGWYVAWRSHDTNNVDDCGHAVDPERAAYAANALRRRERGWDSEGMFLRWLNMCAPDGVTYRVMEGSGYSQGEHFLYVCAFPSDTAPSPDKFARDAEFSEPVNWARGSVQSLAMAHYDADSDLYTFDHGSIYYPVHAEYWRLDQDPYLTAYAEEFRREALNN